MSDRWWHVFGAEIPNMSEDEHGNPGSAFALRIYGDSELGPDDLTEKHKADADEEMFGEIATVRYLGSFDHDPTDEEREALTPEAFR